MTPVGVADAPEVLAGPDHTQLPDSDGAMVTNFQEFPLSFLLLDCLQPILKILFPDGRYAIGQDAGIYWRLTDPPLDGCKAPDWFLVIGVPPLLDGVGRRSYVLWRERVIPLILIEFVSGDGSEEHDRTPNTGKFWVYEQGIRAPYYAIFDADNDRLEVYELRDGRYVALTPNEYGRFLIPPLRVELGIWHGRFLSMELPWLRWWDNEGNLLPSSDEYIEQEKQRARRERRQAKLEKQRAEQAEGRTEQEKQRATQAESRTEREKQRAEKEKRRAEREKQRAEQEKQRAETAEENSKRLAEKLRALGIDPDAV